MISTELSLEVSKKHNLKVMRLFDTSFYYKDQKIENYLIEILPVNKNNWIPFHVSKDFSLVLNSSNLGYKKVNRTEDLLDLPDGIYEIKQSIKPNSLTINHFYHFRTLELRLKHIELLCKHFDSECVNSGKEYRKNTELLTEILQYIESAEYVTEEKHNKSRGIKYYNRAVDLIKTFENECGCIS